MQHGREASGRAQARSRTHFQLDLLELESEPLVQRLEDFILAMAERRRGAGVIGVDREGGAAQVGDAQRIGPGLLEISAQFALDVGQTAGPRQQRVQLSRLFEDLA